jgi:hypothetical protein
MSQRSCAGLRLELRDSAWCLFHSRIRHCSIRISCARVSLSLSLDVGLQSSLNCVRCDHRHGLALLLQPKDEHIIVFADERCSNHVHHDIGTTTEQQATVQAASITLRFSRYTYAGQCISTSKATFKNRSTDWSCVLFNPFTPVNRRGLFRISLTAVCLQFDEQQLKFTAVRPAIAGDEISTAPSLFWWNDTFFQGRDAEWTDDYATWPESGIPGTWPVLFHVGTRYIHTLSSSFNQLTQT